jgi:hypothetical protein
MARRKTVREESRREVGTLDMAYSTLSLFSTTVPGRACLAMMESASCDAKRGRWGRGRGRGFYSPPAPTPPGGVGARPGLGSHRVPPRACSPSQFPTEPGLARGDVRPRVAPGELGVLRCPRLGSDQMMAVGVCSGRV